MPNRSLGNELEVAMAVNIVEAVPLAMAPPSAGHRGSMVGSADHLLEVLALDVGLPFTHTAKGAQEVPWSFHNASSGCQGPAGYEGGNG